jgi:SAM-dependent methyltransferase
MRIPEGLICNAHGARLAPDSGDSVDGATALVCERGCRVPVVGGVPRFVSSDGYARAFGLQWKHFSRTQLDSFTGTTISRDRLARCVGGLDRLRGMRVLEAGCGAGRFTEIMLEHGAEVVAMDLSSAVEANYANHAGREGFFVMQANILEAPVEPASFDVVLCLGVIQHTPDSEATIAALCRHVKPGGLLVIDHYRYDYPFTPVRRILRAGLLKLPAWLSKPLSIGLTRALLPLHRLFWNRRRGSKRARRVLRQYSPVVDYFEVYPELGRRGLIEWAVLDTHDTLTDYYKRFRSVEEITASLEQCGMIDLEVWEGGNGVEARARAPLPAMSSIEV